MYKMTEPLNEFITLQRGFDLPKSQRVDGIVPVIASAGVGGYHNIAKVKGPGVVIGRSGSIGGGQYISEDFWPLNTALWVKDFKGHHPKYVYYLLRNIDFSGFNTGTGVPTLNRNHLGSILVPQIGYKYEEKIAEILSALDDKIKENTQMNQTLEKIAQRIFKSWFIDFDPVKANAEGLAFAGLSPDIQSLFPSEFVESEMGLIPKGWEISSLGEISDFQNGYAFKASTLSHEKSGNCKAVLKMGNIKKGGGFKWDGSKDYFTLQNGELGKLAKHIANRGDLLMSMTDMKANVALLGHTACMPVDGEFLVNQRVGHIKVKDIQTADYPFLYIQTNESKFIHELRSQANSGVQVNLSTSAIKAAKILLPAKTVHIAFNNAVKSMFERIFENEIQNRTLARIRGKLLPKLLSGSIKINQKLDEAS
jgi:type I restriction enzyme S subunit